jgi:hypothetical protein
MNHPSIIFKSVDKVRKEIHLPQQTIRDLRIVAALFDKSPKKYLEDLVIENVKSQIIKIRSGSDQALQG